MLLAVSGTIETAMQAYKSLGMLNAVFLPFIEAFLPFLPLCGIVVANAAAFGLIKGLILSSVGSITGTWVLYGTFYYFGNYTFLRKLREKELVKKYAEWVENKGFIFIAIFCFVPVLLNSVIAILAGINKISFRTFAFASGLGIFFLFCILSIIGSSLTTMTTSPWKIVLIIILCLLLFVVGRQVQKHLIQTKRVIVKE
ncbi:TVP38/TMEM64 family protein [Bacillus massilioanorexius]|uniref:TVP38/TMEM64 family protein n=1 Tax=Bacillus massilioanorexius TaxID=1468413 RepID=UPI000373100E|nr:VTT domain-containing protein [Bacillus massilioanorexius]